MTNHTITIQVPLTDGTERAITGQVLGAFLIHQQPSARLAAYPYRVTHWPTGRCVADARSWSAATAFASDLIKSWYWAWTTPPACGLPEHVATLRRAWLRSGKIA